MSPLKIIVTDPIAPEGLAVLREAGIQADVKTDLSTEALKAALPEYDGWIIRSGTKATRELIEAATDLKVIGRAGVGIDNIDVDAATERGVVVMNTPYGNTLSVAEHTIGLMLALSRHVATGTASLRNGQWLRKELKGVEVAGKTLGIVGLGRIGKEVARRAQGLDMKVVGSDPFISADVAKGLGIELLPLDQLWPRVDFLTVHVPLTPKTKGIIGSEAFQKIKKGARILNVARGGVVDEKALLAAITSGTVAGAALDVFESEPPKGNPLIDRPEVIGTPHLGASTAEASIRCGVEVCEQVAAYLVKGEAQNAVNLAASPDPQTAPYLPLAEALGAWAVQLVDGQPKRIMLQTGGDAGKAQSALLLDAALKGLLEIAKGGGRVTLVNARMLAGEMGIQAEASVEPGAVDYPSLVVVTLETDDGNVRVSGTNLGKLGPRIVDVEGYEVEVKPHGRFLVLRHTDEPGTVSRVSGLLGDHDINIAQMVVGRIAPRGKAISIIRIDDPVPDAVLEYLTTSRRFERVHRVEV
ncbi:MAG: phosphoglycerate dehydrogenase [Euryarchaeota archaeon]|nr:phosphoglycerate dehydrogenase [Euryarchaeota archaeon]